MYLCSWVCRIIVNIRTVTSVSNNLQFCEEVKLRSDTRYQRHCSCHCRAAIYLCEFSPDCCLYSHVLYIIYTRCMGLEQCGYWLGITLPCYISMPMLVTSQLLRVCCCMGVVLVVVYWVGGTIIFTNTITFIHIWSYSPSHILTYVNTWQQVYSMYGCISLHSVSCWLPSSN